MNYIFCIINKYETNKINIKMYDNKCYFYMIDIYYFLLNYLLHYELS